jgi:para-aminobenzoate synthetase component I
MINSVYNLEKNHPSEIKLPLLSVPVSYHVQSFITPPSINPVDTLLNLYGERSYTCVVKYNQKNFIFLEPVWNYTHNGITGQINFSNESHLVDGKLLLNPIDEVFSSTYSGDWVKGEKAGPPFLTGFIRYEYLNFIEDIPPITPKSINFSCPLFLWNGYQLIIEVEDLNPQIKIYNVSYLDNPSPLWKVEEPIISILNTVNNNCLTHSLKDRLTYNDALNLINLRSTINKKSYLLKINEIKEHIKNGDVYQVNLCNQITIDCDISPTTIMSSGLYSLNANHGAYINWNNSSTTNCIVSLSPELFFSTNGSLIRCRPIKGTAKRGSNFNEDILLAKQLIESNKDRSELAMIIDLLRNDLARFCDSGSIKVNAFATLEKYSYLFHLVGDITGNLRNKVKFSDIINSIFPCGSITGAPKIAAIKYINELEGVDRGIYTGTIGFGSSLSDLHFNVAIRTILFNSTKAILGSGGGITIQSDPEAEYQETIVKAEPLLRLIKLSSK